MRCTEASSDALQRMVRGRLLSWSYNFIARGKSGEETQTGILATIMFLSPRLFTDEMCVVGRELNTVISTGRQLLKLPDLPVQARMLVSPARKNQSILSVMQRPISTNCNTANTPRAVKASLG